MLLIVAATFLLGSVSSLECELITNTASSPTSHYGTLTPFYGNETVWEDYTVTGATCSTSGGTMANLESIPWTDFDAKYRCKCMGSFAYTRTRYCTLHVWRCFKGSKHA